LTPVGAYPLLAALCLIGRFFTLNVVRGGGVGLSFGLLLLFRGIEMAGAVVPSVLDIIVLGQGRDQGGAAGDLADAAEDDFGAAVIKFDRAVNFDGAAGESAHVPDIFQVVGKDDYGKRTGHLIFAEVEEVNAVLPGLYPQHLTGHAARFPDMLAGLRDRDAIGGESRKNERCPDEQPKDELCR